MVMLKTLKNIKGTLCANSDGIDALKERYCPNSIRRNKQKQNSGLHTGRTGTIPPAPFALVIFEIGFRLA
jgi:hypothetical protein